MRIYLRNLSRFAWIAFVSVLIFISQSQNALSGRLNDYDDYYDGNYYGETNGRYGSILVIAFYFWIIFEYLQKIPLAIDLAGFYKRSLEPYAFLKKPGADWSEGDSLEQYKRKLKGRVWAIVAVLPIYYCIDYITLPWLQFSSSSYCSEWARGVFVVLLVLGFFGYLGWAAVSLRNLVPNDSLSRLRYRKHWIDYDKQHFLEGECERCGVPLPYDTRECDACSFSSYLG